MAEAWQALMGAITQKRALPVSLGGLASAVPGDGRERSSVLSDELRSWTSSHIQERIILCLSGNWARVRLRALAC